MKKHKLTDNLSTGFSAIGIVTSEKDYRLSFKLNKILGINLAKSELPLLSNEEKGSPLPVMCHFFAEPVSGKTFYLVKNKQENFFVLPKYKMADYIFVVTDPSPVENNKQNFKSGISAIANIQSTFDIPDQQLKNLHID